MSDRRATLEALRDMARLVVTGLDNLIESVAADADGDQLLDLHEIREEFRLGRDALKSAEARGELELSRGARGQLLATRRALETYLRRPRPSRKRRGSENVFDLDAWQAKQDADLALAGGRK